MKREYTLKNGQTVLIRRAEPQEAAATIAYVEQVSGESDNLTFGPGEWSTTLEQQTAYIERCFTADNEVYLVAVVDGEIVGATNFGGGKRARNRHVGEFGITVRKPYWGQSIGRYLLQGLIDWARVSGVIRKIDLRVRTDNQAGVALYEKLGFVKEGLLTRDICIGGALYDVYTMGLQIDPQAEGSE